MCIVIAGFLDAFDGDWRRLLKAESPLGAQLDSLTDFVNFGIAPVSGRLFMGAAINRPHWVGGYSGLFGLLCLALGALQCRYGRGRPTGLEDQVFRRCAIAFSRWLGDVADLFAGR